MHINSDHDLPPLSVLADRLNEETPYRCICRNGGAEIYVADTRLWFEERVAREVLTAVLFVGDEEIDFPAPGLISRGVPFR